MIITRNPFRITLAGGGTDLPSYYKHNGGLVASMAIDKYVYITLKPDDFEKLYKLRYSEIEIVDNVDHIKNTRAKEALKLHSVSAVEINTCADLSSKSGLGSSGSFLVGLLHAIRRFKNLQCDPNILADEACQIEIDILKEPVGKQDQYIAALGGVQLLHIDQKGNVHAKSLSINLKPLIENMHVYSLNTYRNASDILHEQNKASINTLQILDQIREIGKSQIKYLSTGDFNEYGRTLDRYWTLKKMLSNAISIPLADNIYADVKRMFNVLGGKIIGAGGGGFILLYLEDKHQELEEYMKQQGLAKLEYSIDTYGSKLLGDFL